MAGEEITLGQHILALEPVSIPRARRGITRALEAAGGSFGDMSESVSNGQAVAMFAGAGERVLYDLLTAVIPGLKARMPVWEFCGFASQDAMDADDYAEDKDRAPTSAQVQEALSAAWRVSQLGKWIRPLSGVVDPLALRAVVTGLLEDGAKAMAQTISSTTSPSSSGEFPSESGSPTVAKDSPRNGSKRFSPVAEAA